jgi:hypothetical protein
MIKSMELEEPLSQLVRGLWYVKKDGLAESEQVDIIPPSGLIHIVYNMADPYCLITEEDCVEVPDIVLAGQFKHPLQVKYQSNLHQLGIALSPAALSFMFNTVGGLYTEAMIDCSHFESMQSLHQVVSKAVNPIKTGSYDLFDPILSYFKDYYFKTLEASNTLGPFHAVSDILDYIDVKDGQLEVGDLAKHFNYSISAIERLFKKHIGLTPKTYLDIIRFRKAVLSEDPTSLFYDQSHFIKQCKKFTSKIPKALSESEELTFLHVLGLVD